MALLKKNEENECDKHCHYGNDFGRKIIMTLVGVLLVYGIFYLGTLVRDNIKKYYYIGQADQMERTITVTGFGKVNGVNDIAVTTIGFSNVDKDVKKAQDNNSKVMDPVSADLKKLGIEAKDLQTSYTISPEYNYTQDKGQVLVGYRVQSSVQVKIRDLSKIPDVLGLAGKYGANEVNGLSFTIDDKENLKTAARDKALADASLKARKLAQSLGVRLVEVISYNEYEGGSDYPVYAMKAEGMGGAAGSGPDQVSGGSQDVNMNVNITYKIMPWQ